VEHFTEDGFCDRIVTFKDFLWYHRKVEEIILVINRSFSKVPVKGNLEFIELKRKKKEAVAKLAELMGDRLDILEGESQQAVLRRKKTRTHKWVPGLSETFDTIPRTRGGGWVERKELLDVEEAVEEEFIRPVVIKVMGIAKWRREIVE
jgi:hypothetical protein